MTDDKSSQWPACEEAMNVLDSILVRRFLQDKYHLRRSVTAGGEGFRDIPGQPSWKDPVKWAKFFCDGPRPFGSKIGDQQGV